MAVSISYKTLFQLDILHHFFLNGGSSNQEFEVMNDENKAKQLKLYNVSNFFQIIPDQQTSKLLRGSKQLFHLTPTGFRVLVSANADDTPVVDIAEGTKWVFGLVLKDYAFSNYTSIRLNPSFDLTNVDRNNLPRIFYYSNTKSGITAPNISFDIPDFNNGNSYQMNDLVLHNSAVYEAIENNPSGTTPDLADSGWDSVNTQPYATYLDELRWRPSFFNYRFTQADIWTKLGIENYSNTEVWSGHGQGTAENMLYPLDMSPYQTGKYRLAVTGNGYSDTQEFYYHPEFQGKALFGIVEIFHESSLGGLSVLNDLGEIIERQFELRFKNRLTQWRYFDQEDRTAITGVTGNSDALPLTNNGFISTVQKASKSLPNPDAAIIQTESDAIYSDVYINSSRYP